MKSIFRIIILTLLTVIFCLAGLLIYSYTGKAPLAEKIDWGITFSQVFAEQMGLDWRTAYLAMLDDLGVKKLRLIAYWQKIEPEPGKYSFADLDWQIDQANKRGAEVILVMGRKLPRWPECHIPDWAKGLSESEQQEKILSLLAETVKHYQNNQAIKIWQVENEPFLKTFGVCPELDKKFLEKEIYAVQQADSCANRRPIMLTASGELSSWTQTVSGADILGTTLYRIVWHEWVGYFKYPIPAVFYYKRANLVRWLTGVKRIMIVELQAEPWSRKQLYESSLEEQAKSMDLEKFREIIDYTRQTGFDEAYLWGAEWWYWLKEKHHDSSFWQEAKKLWIN